MFTEQLRTMGNISQKVLYMFVAIETFCAAEKARCECLFSCFFLFGSVVMRALDLQDSF